LTSGRSVEPPRSAPPCGVAGAEAGVQAVASWTCDPPSSVRSIASDTGPPPPAFTSASTLLGVAALGYPDQLVVLELTAARWTVSSLGWRSSSGSEASAVTHARYDADADPAQVCRSLPRRGVWAGGCGLHFRTASFAGDRAELGARPPAAQGAAPGPCLNSMSGRSTCSSHRRQRKSSPSSPPHSAWTARRGGPLGAV
jgi:hypothetical protein